MSPEPVHSHKLALSTPPAVPGRVSRASRLAALLIALLLAALPAAAQSVSRPRPKVRTITAFVRLERALYKTQIADALRVLHTAKEEFTGAGYEVETLRISTQPFSAIVRGMSEFQAINFFHDLDKLAQQQGFILDVGPAMLRDSDDPSQAELLAQIIAGSQNINGFIVVADAAGIHWNGIHEAARVIKYLEEHTDHGDGNFRFAAAAFPPANAPFFPVSYTQGTGHGFAIGLESAGIVNQAFTSAGGDLPTASLQLTEALGAEAKKAEEMARRIEKLTGWSYLGIDLTPVPLKEVSIGAAMETLLEGPIGSPGSLSVAFAITSALRRIPVLQTGYSGLMLPVLEDTVLARRWEAGRITRDALLSYSAVCSAGLDAIPLPGDISQRELASIISDMASLAVKWKKPLSARLLPAAGRRVGEMTDFSSQYLVNIRIR
ncbi:MAG: DUF711 family protein [Acidobacteriia bacterium]|nr:DUF711 family protein [Terriglobia bacterium]